MLQSSGLIDREFKYTGKNPICEIIYIIPKNKGVNQNIIDFKYIADWLENTHRTDLFEQSLMKTLRHWYYEYSK